MKLIGIVFTAIAAFASVPAIADDEVFTSVVTSVISEPHPVAGADGKMHLAYEIYASNPSSHIIAVDQVSAMAPDGSILQKLDGDALAAVFKNFSGDGTSIQPGGNAIIFMDATYAIDTAAPASIVNSFAIRRLVPGKDGAPPTVLPDVSGVSSTFTFVGAASPVGAPAVVLQPPLRGARWMMTNGCCAEITSHRGAVEVIDGVPYVPERFAIDFIQLTDNDEVFVGDPTKLESYAYFGSEVYSAADGKVVWLSDISPEQVPTTPSTGLTPATMGGNSVVVDIGDGRFAFYAHMQPGSLRVKVGDVVKAGDVLGLLGNTGNSDAPHLHFHVMDRVGPLNAYGLPYVFTSFTSRGTGDESSFEGAFTKGEPMKVVVDATVGPQSNRLPLNAEVVDFGE